MPNPKTQVPGRPHLRRDQQQWIFDYVVQQSRQVFHWWWSELLPMMPAGVRSHAMISKCYGRDGLKAEAEAKRAEESGDRELAYRLYYEATKNFVHGQHPIFEINDEKRFLYSGVQRCYDKVRELAPYRIERIDVPWEGTTVSGWLHLLPTEQKAPLIFCIGGCDTTSEMSLDPISNGYHKRGAHVFCFDGPGQGQSNMRGIKLTPDNYERAASAALSQLLERPEFVGDKIGLHGIGFGSWWGLRFAAFDHRISAIATTSTYTDLYYLMNEESPRWKQMFAYLMQAASEEELDREVEKMTLDGYMELITCPVLMMDGEYNLRDPIEEVFEVFDQLKAPAEMWVFADYFQQFLMPDGSPPKAAMLDWLKDRLDGKPMRHAGDVLYLERGGEGPNSPNVPVKRRWFEASKIGN